MRDSVRGQWRSGLGLFKDPAPPKSARVSCTREAYTRARAYTSLHVHARARNVLFVYGATPTFPSRAHIRQGCCPLVTRAAYHRPRRATSCVFQPPIARFSSGPSFFLLASIYHPRSAPTRVTMVRLSPHFLGFRGVGGEVLRGRAEQRAETVPSGENSTLGHLGGITRRE